MEWVKVGQETADELDAGDGYRGNRGKCIERLLDASDGSGAKTYIAPRARNGSHLSGVDRRACRVCSPQQSYRWACLGVSLGRGDRVWETARPWPVPHAGKPSDPDPSANRGGRWPDRLVSRGSPTGSSHRTRTSCKRYYALCGVPCIQRRRLPCIGGLGGTTGCLYCRTGRGVSLRRQAIGSTGSAQHGRDDQGRPVCDASRTG